MNGYVNPDTIRVLNTDVMNTDASTLLSTWTSGTVFTPNVDHFVLLQRDREFYDAYRSADHVVMDSRVVFLLWKLRRPSFKAQIAGSDLFPLFCEHHRNDPAVTVFLLGAREGVGEEAAGLINGSVGRPMVIGWYAPKPGFELDPAENARIIEKITQSKATVLAVALGTPKQELWIYRNRSKLPSVGRFIGIGATLDFMTGRQRRAPVWLRKAGGEWLFRLLHEPGRLFHRYLIRDLTFFYYLLLQWTSNYKDPFENH